MARAGRTIAIILCAASGSCIGCSSRRGTSASHPDGGQKERVASKCDASPQLLVDPAQQLPGWDAGPNVAEGVEVPWIAVDGTFLYYIVNWQLIERAGPASPFMVSAPRAGDVMRIPKGGGRAVRIAQLRGGGSMGYGQALTHVGIVAYEDGEPDAGVSAGIVLIPLDGGDTTVLAEPRSSAATVVADDENVYFVDGEGTKSVPLAGGPVRMLTTEAPAFLGLVGKTLYLAHSDTGVVSSSCHVFSMAGASPKPEWPRLRLDGRQRLR